MKQDTIERLNLRFDAIGAWSFDHRSIVLLGCLALLTGSTWLALGVRFDNSMAAYFDTGDPLYVAYNRYREDFGSDEVSYIVYEAPDRAAGPFDLEVMRKIAKLTTVLEEEVPFVKEVTSLANAERIEGVADGIEIYELLENFPSRQEDLDRIRDIVLSEPLYVGGLVSADGHYAAVMIDMYPSTVDPVDELRLDPEGGDGLENLYPQVSYSKIEEILARPEYAGIVFHHVGDVPLNSIYNTIINRETSRLGGFTLLAIGGLLLLFFRRLMGVIAPLLVVSLSLVVAFGFVGLLGWKLDLMVIMLPVLLIAVGVADAVHILAEFQSHFAELGDRREAARRTLRLVGTPCLLTSVTTAAGFSSMSISPIQSIAHFAIYSSVGVLAAFFLSVTLLFVLISFGPRKIRREASESEIVRAKGGERMLRALGAVARFDIRHRRAILAVSALLFAVSAVGIARLKVDSNFMSEFSEDEPIRIETNLVDEVMGGSLSFIYLFDSGAPEGVKNPEVLREIERVQAMADAQTDIVKKSYSINDVLKDLNQAFHAEDPAYYDLPESQELVAQYLLLYEMSGGEDVESFVSSDYAVANVELRCKSVMTSELSKLADGIDDYLEANPLQASTVEVTGMGALWLKLQEYITTSQIRGFALAFSVIAVIMCVIFQSVKTGLLVMIPNLTPVVLTLGAMGWLGVPLDYVRLMLASVVIGISVDDTIHHMTRFRYEFRRSGNYADALRVSIIDVGRALFITSVVLVLGFLVFRLSTLDTLMVFGGLLATAIAIALLADFLLMPALVLTFEPFGPEPLGPKKYIEAASEIAAASQEVEQARATAA